MLSNIIITAFLTSIVSAVASKTNVALYWGQNSQGSQTRLASYCQSEDADIYILAFTYIFGYDHDTQVNFANACSDTYEDGLLKCSTISEDIKTCQSLGKKVLLSLGGASGAYGFSDDTQAEDFAGELWNMFGNGSDDSVERPFLDAVVDGFDFDIENNIQTGYVALANKLRTYFDADTSKDYYLSAAPQCPYPDASVGQLLEQSYIDFAFIQFYNNYCSTIGGNFNWKTWADYAAQTSPNPNIQIYLGLPGGTGAAGSGYATIDQIQSTLESSIVNIADANFGGIVLWDASWSASNVVDGLSFGNKLKQLLLSEYSGTNDDSTSTTSSTTAKDLETTDSTSSTTTPEAPATTSKTSTTTPEAPQTTPDTETTTPDAPTTAPETTTSNEIEPTTSSTHTVAPPQNQETTIAPDTSSITTITTSTTSLALPTETNNNKGASDDNSGSSSGDSSSDSSSKGGDCSSLTALEKAQCLNSNFANGKYLGNDVCTEGEIACSSEGHFAICNFGNWVQMPCAAGTTCYAYNYGDQVDVGCDYTDSKSKYQKRDSIFSSIFKRHLHHAHFL